MWLSNVRLVLPEQVLEGASLRMEDGYIAEIIEGSAPEPARPTPELTVIPGIIDLHGDMLERDVEPRPGARFPVEMALYELDKRLANAGITTAFAAVGFAWTQNDLRTQEKAIEIIRTINATKHQLLVDFQIHARFEITNPDTAPILAGLLDERLVQLVSIMDHTPGQGQYTNIPKYVDFMTRWLGFDPSKIGVDIMTRLADAVETKTSQPRSWDVARQVAHTARAHGIPVASHDDDTVEKVAEIADLGVTISEFPVRLEAAHEARRRGMHVIMGAPNAYRGTSTGDNLSARDAISADVVDILATDYFPPAMLQSAFLLDAQDVLPLHKGIQLIAQNPADAMGMTDRGRLEVGRRADLVLVEHVGVFPRVRATFRAGMPIYRDSHTVNHAQPQPTVVG